MKKKALILIETRIDKTDNQTLKFINYLTKKFSGIFTFDILCFGNQNKTEKLSNNYNIEVVHCIQGVDDDQFKLYTKELSEVICQIAPDIIFARSNYLVEEILGTVSVYANYKFYGGISSLNYDDDCLCVEKNILNNCYTVSKRLALDEEKKIITVGNNIWNNSEIKATLPDESNLNHANIELYTFAPKNKLISVGTYANSNDFNNSRLIVSGGKGLQSSHGFNQLIELKEIIDCEIGASRAAVDSEIASKNRQIGQTGQTVQPEVYLALGISGATQHIAGILGSKIIIAVNKDRQANIFNYSDYGIVADVSDFLNEFIKQLSN